MKKFQKIKLVSFILTFFLLFVFLNFIFPHSKGLAQEIEYPKVPGTPPLPQKPTFPEYVRYLFNLVVFISGLIALFVLVWAGICYFLAAGDPTKITSAKNRILGAFLGLIILLSSYLILLTINPQLTIFQLPEIPSRELPPSSEIPPPTPPTLTFQEIPIGTLVENILAKNISCFDKDRNLIDCQSGNFLQASTTNVFASTTHFHYCYKYDSDGNKESLLENHDRFDCLKNLLGAIETKSQKLRDLVEELKDLMDQLKEKSEELEKYAKKCDCTVGCSQSCWNCGCGDSSCDCNCLNSSDLCPNRANMNSLRENTIPDLIEKIEKKRIEINTFIFGANPTDSYTFHQPTDTDLGNLTTKTYYLSDWDPNTTSTFLTYQEALDRLNSFISEFEQELKDLKEAEEKMKRSYGDRLTLTEFLDLKTKIKKIIQEAQFKDYKIGKYCWEFNCTATSSQGLCISCQLTISPTSTLICKSPDYYRLDGDPATFYFNEEYKEEPILEQEECVIETKIEKSFPIGLIPIGETVDETEEFANSTLSPLKDLYNELVAIKNEALSAKDESGEAVKDAWKLIDFTSEGTNSSQDCVVNCTDVPCTCSCSCVNPVCCEEECETVGEDGEEVCQCVKWTYTPQCSPCSGFPCPFSNINTNVNSISNHFSKVKDYSNRIDNRVNKLPNFRQRFENLIEAKNLLTSDQNRCTLLDKLTISRNELEKCITGYGVALPEEKARTIVFSCQMGLDLVHLGKLVILPDFPYPPSTTYLNCYPFNSGKLTSSQKMTCFKNKDSPECQDYIKDLMDNYYCCHE